ncbi:Cell cycle checkpoint protein rad17 [Thalictrum thalictroides]|uniref:Cell cycle checkpoint protein rad17 n=1 Tax=Thalictrum thalictroides TaxID=46969 RepID=A0A7J6UUD8_THATH|nr:Cell cycle checkpoint protein rad17 [Thalictrum thalictroides]
MCLIGVHYMSKLDEFENFVERIRKYPLLPFNPIGKSLKPPILLIDDLPLINGKQGLGRLRKCLCTLVGSVQIPTIILITEYARVDSSKNSACDWEDLLSSLENAGVCKMAFNPITTNSVKKTLSKICREERCSVTAEQIDQIARVSGGDIRHAITSLQYFCLTPTQLLSFNTIHSNDKADELQTSDDVFTLSFGRDETLSLFHALGKFLHNKRETVNIAGFGQDLLLLSEKFARLPIKMDAPEKVLCQANAQARPVADFLHENVLDFLSG